MQNRRTNASSPLSLWPSTESRIQSLKTSVSTMLLHSLPPAEKRSPMVVALLTDLFAKKLWDQLQLHSDPDVINQYIVLYGQVAASAPADDTTRAEATQAEAPPVPTSSASVDRLLHDLEEHDEPRADERKKPRSSLPHDLTNVISAMKDSSVSDTRTEPPPSSEVPQAASLSAEPWNDDLDVQAHPMNVPPDVPEAPWPPTSASTRTESHKYQVRVPKKVRDVLAQRDSDLYDEWYQYMQRQDPGAIPCEGAVLLQLRSNLEGLVASFDHEASTAALFTSDVKAVLQAAQSMLPSHPKCDQVQKAIEYLSSREWIQPAKLEPLRVAIVQRLQQLYDEFLVDAKAVHVESPPSRSAPLPSSTYERRRARQGPSHDAARQISVLDVSESADSERAVDPRTLQVLVTMEEAPGSGTGGYAVLRTWSHFEALHTELVRMYEKLPNDSGLVAPPPLPSLKGLPSSEACEAIRTYLVALLVPAEHTLAWYNTTQAVQRFLDKTRTADDAAKLKNNVLMSSLGGVSRSLASGLAGAAGTARKSVGQIAPTPSRASRIFGLRPDMSDARRGQASDAPELPPRSMYEPLRDMSHTPTAHHDKADVATTSAAQAATQAMSTVAHAASATANVAATAATAAATTVSGSQAASSTPATASAAVEAPPEDSASVHDVQALLTAVFAVTREALNMHEAWTLQRGMLRVIEQFLRTTYYNTVANLVTYLAGLLSIDAQVSWLQLLRTMLWPNDVWTGGAPASAAPARTSAEVRATAEAARAVVLSYVPPQAAYALGLGGKQAVADALATVHDVVTNPVVSLDLHLALLLRVLDLAMGTAGAPSGDRA